MCDTVEFLQMALHLTHSWRVFTEHHEGLISCTDSDSKLHQGYVGSHTVRGMNGCRSSILFASGVYHCVLVQPLLKRRGISSVYTGVGASQNENERHLQCTILSAEQGLTLAPTLGWNEMHRAVYQFQSYKMIYTFAAITGCWDGEALALLWDGTLMACVAGKEAYHARVTWQCGVHDFSV